MKDKFYLTVISALLIAIGYLVYEEKKQSVLELSDKNAKIASAPSLTPEEEVSGSDFSDTKVFPLKSFHGVDFDEGIFEFKYPANWHNDGQYFSPIRIKYYDMVSVDAPVYFDLISTVLFETSDVKYQMVNDKRRSPDSIVKIDGKTFRKYDLVDYGSSSEESTGRVIIYVGPQISFGGDGYYLVFRWEENPLTSYMLGNSPEVFEKMIMSLRFL